MTERGMRNMKAKMHMAVIISMFCVSLCACQGAPTPDSGNAGETDGQAGGGQTESGPDEMGEQSPDDGGGEQEASGRSLTEEELQTFTEELGADENFGFLYSVYADPSEIDLEQVFYCGAGIATEPMSDEEVRAYLSVTGYDEIYTDVTRIEKADLEEFVLKKTGMTYDQMKQPLEWVYLEEYDIYCNEHGDTNYQPYVCVAGWTADETTFTLRCHPDMSYLSLEDDGYRVMDCELTVQKQDDGYRFLSNRMLTEEGLIEDQTFSVTVPEHGEVTIAAYEPNEGTPQADVTFVMLGKNGQVIQVLSGSHGYNIRAAAEAFAGVAAVGFRDYNGDGLMDLITITDYSYIQGPDVGTGFEEIRIYSGNEYGYFYYEEDLSAFINAECTDYTIQGVCDFLSNGVLGAEE